MPAPIPRAAESAADLMDRAEARQWPRRNGRQWRWQRALWRRRSLRREWRRTRRDGNQRQRYGHANCERRPVRRRANCRRAEWLRSAPAGGGYGQGGAGDSLLGSQSGAVVMAARAEMGQRPAAKSDKVRREDKDHPADKDSQVGKARRAGQGNGGRAGPCRQGSSNTAATQNGANGAGAQANNQANGQGVPGGIDVSGGQYGGSGSRKASSGSQSGSSAQGGQGAAAGSAASGVASGDSSSGSSSPGGSPSSGGSGSGAQSQSVSVNAGTPQNPFAPQGKKSHSMAKSRGRDWGLQDAGTGMAAAHATDRDGVLL